MVGLGMKSGEGSTGDQHVVVANVDALKTAIMWGVYRALWLWFATWLLIGALIGIIGLVVVGSPFGSGGSPFRSSSSLEDAYVASMKSDLRNLVTAEDAVFADSVKYIKLVNGRIGWFPFTVTVGNNMPTVTITADGWTATMSSTGTTTTCAIFIGSTPIAPATREGEPACK